MTLEKGSLVLVDYTAKVKDTNEVFETTFEEEAKKSDTFDPTHKYEPRLVSVGDGWVLKGLDEAIASSDIGQKLSLEITPDKAFGERDPNKVRMVPQRKLGEKADEVKVGDIIEMDDRVGIIRYIGSGRVQVDFNHRFAGRTLAYDVNIIKKLDSDEDKLGALIKRRIPVSGEKIKAKVSEETAEIELPDEVYLTEGLQIIKKAIANDVFKFIPKLKEIKYIETYNSTPSTTAAASQQTSEAKDTIQNEEKQQQPAGQDNDSNNITATESKK